MKHIWLKGAAMVAAVLMGSIGFEAQAKWVYDADAKTLSDGNYSFPVRLQTGTTGNKALTDPATGELVSGLNITGVPTTGSGDLDFTSVEADTGYKVIEIDAIQVVNSITDCKKVTAPDVMKLYRQTFGNNTAIEELVISDKITSFPYYCFAGASNLKKITPTEFPYVTEQKDQNAFNGAKSLEGELSFPNLVKVGSSAFCGCAGLTKVSMPQVQVIGEGVFNGSGLMGDLEYPELKSIGSLAFNGVSGMTSFAASKLEVIGSYAFKNCSGMTNFIAAAVTNVGASAFNWCSAVTKIRLGPDCAENYGNNVYNDCSNLVDLEPMPSLRNIENNLKDPLLACSSLTCAIEVTSSGEISSLGQYWMRDLYCVTSVTIRAKQVVSVSAGAMRNLGKNMGSVAVIYWNTEKAPTSFNTSYGTFEHGSSGWNRIIVKNDIEGWKALSSFVDASTLAAKDSTDRADWPGKKTIGKLGNVWLVEASPSFCIRIQ